MGLILYGKVLKVDGLNGGISILPFSRELENLSRLGRVFIQKKHDEQPCEYKIRRRALHKNTATLELEGITNPAAAEEFLGGLVMVDAADLLEPEEDEYYWFQLLGLEVYTTEGAYMGKVKNLIDRNVQSLLVVDRKGSDILVPMVDSIVREISLKDSRIIISPVKGLID